MSGEIRSVAPSRVTAESAADEQAVASKFSPGPWEAKTVFGYGDSVCIVAPGRGRPIAKTIRDKRFFTDFAPTADGTGVILSEKHAAAAGRYVATPEARAEIVDREVADGHLLAAAPELYAALFDLCAEAERVGIWPGVADQIDPEIYEKARAALVKACGQQVSS